jgi:hypothetical protein
MLPLLLLLGVGVATNEARSPVAVRESATLVQGDGNPPVVQVHGRRHCLSSSAVRAAIKTSDDVLLPLTEASGAAFGDLLAAGRFCSGAGAAQEAAARSLARIAVVDSTARSLELLGGPTPFKMVAHNFSASVHGTDSPQSAIRAVAAVDTDTDGFTELILAAKTSLITVHFAPDCSSVVVHEFDLGGGAEIVGLAGWGAGRLLVVRESGAIPFLSATAAAPGSDWTVEPVSADGLGHTLPERNATSWRVVAGVEHEVGRFVLVNDSHVISLTQVHPAGLRVLAVAPLQPVAGSTKPPSRPVGAAIIDPEGDGQHIAAVVAQDSMAMLFMMPYLDTLQSQALDPAHPHWGAVVSVALSQDYGNATRSALNNAPWVHKARLLASGERQQLVGLRKFAELDGCPGQWHRAPAGDATLCCADASCGAPFAHRPINASARCCLQRGRLSGYAGAPPCRADGADGGSGTTVGQFSVSLLVFGGGSLWQPRAAAFDNALMQEGMPNWFGPDQPPLGAKAGTDWHHYMINGLLDTGTNLFSHTVCDRQSLVTRNDSWHYENFLKMLELSAQERVNGVPLRMAIYLIGNGHEEHGNGCLAPVDSALTPTINESAIFSGSSPDGPIYGYTDGTGYIRWAELIGQLSRIYPHLVGVSVDDYSHSVQAPAAIFTPTVVAAMQAAMRRHSAWLGLAPTMYYGETHCQTGPIDGPCEKLAKNYQWIWARWPDLPLAIDVPLFTFRNGKQGTGPCSGANLPPPGTLTGCLEILLFLP